MRFSTIVLGTVAAGFVLGAALHLWAPAAAIPVVTPSSSAVALFSTLAALVILVRQALRDESL